jgi:hypothetical protein
MLEIGSKTLTIDGITVFADHADPNQFWYLPGPVQLARRPQDNKAAFTFIKYGDLKNETVLGKGFLMVELNLHLNTVTQRNILARLASIAPDKPKLAAVPFDEGTVKCIALDLQGEGGTVAQVSAAGTFQAVEQILGATTPSLHGDNSAAFSLTLSKEGAVLLERVFEEGGMPIGAVYSLTYTGLRPALEVEITANFKRVYDHFSANLEGQVYFVRAGIDAGFEKLVQDGIIKIKVINFSTADNRMQQENWALEFFKEKLLTEWFTPTLTPGELKGGLAKAENLDAVRQRANAFKPQPTPPPPIAPAGAPVDPIAPNAKAAVIARPRKVVQTGAPESAMRVMPAPVTDKESEADVSAMPAPSDAPAPVKTAGLKYQVPNTPSPNNVALDSAVVSFKLKYIHQVEDKTLTFKYNRAEAVQRTYAPQGFFGLLVSDLSKKGHFFEIDGDDPFFREFKVSVESPFDKQRIGLASAHLQLDYGRNDGAAKHKDFILDSRTAEKQVWTIKMIPDLTQYKYQVQYHFNPDTGWDGEKLSYEFPLTTTEDRTLMVHPFDRLGFLELEISATLIDWSVVSHVEIRLHYEDAAGWTKKQSFFFTEANKTAQFWKLRLSKPENRAYRYEIDYHLKDGKIRTTAFPSTEATKLAIPHPFYIMDVEFQPLFAPRSVQTVFIDVEYEDVEQDYRIQKRLKLDGSKTDSVNLRLHLVDSAKRLFKYRCQFIGSNNSVTRKPAVKTNETLLFIGLTEPEPAMQPFNNQ